MKYCTLDILDRARSHGENRRTHSRELYIFAYVTLRVGQDILWSKSTKASKTKQLIGNLCSALGFDKYKSFRYRRVIPDILEDFSFPEDDFRKSGSVEYQISTMVDFLFPNGITSIAAAERRYGLRS